MNMFSSSIKKIEEYPPLLEVIPDTPKHLYYKGNWSPQIFEKCLAVVGARKMTSYGKRVVEQLVKEVAEAGITVVSGFMYGIDALSHQAALNAHKRTIAVMPCGIDKIHPEYQEKLYYDILNNNGLIVSEFEGNFPPARWTYPKRNRIVAGLSKAVLVVEAGEKSGALITADYAKHYKRKIFAVPGPITSFVSKGTNRLISEGATPVSGSREILDFFDIKKKQLCFSTTESAQKIGGLEKRILEILKSEPMEIDDLSGILGVSSSRLGAILSLMCLDGLLSQDGRKYYFN